MAKRAKASRSSKKGFRLSAPKRPIFLISLVLAIVALASAVIPILLIAPHAFWLVIIAYILLALGVAMRGL
ncbi:MAG: hypothetical protein HY659_06310 [Rhizobiales bacterium]|nr:hypothetical protein [Hyphomicrobiales bacterium]